MNRTDWLANLKEGDEVVWAGRIYGITRTTNTRVMIRYRNAATDREVAFHKKTGREVGHKDIWHFSSISPVTTELRTNIERAKLKRHIEYVLSNKALPLETLRQMAKLASG